MVRITAFKLVAEDHPTSMLGHRRKSFEVVVARARPTMQEWWQQFFRGSPLVSLTYQTANPRKAIVPSRATISSQAYTTSQCDRPASLGAVREESNLNIGTVRVRR